MRRKRRGAVYALSLAALLLLQSVTVFGDDHIVWEETITYAEYTYPKMVYELWIGKDRVCSKGGVYRNILRHDVQKKWTIHTEKRRYLEKALIKANEDVLEKAKESAVKQEKPLRIHEIGWDYEPLFDWRVETAGENRLLDGKKCRYFVLVGDADYAEETREVWAADRLPIDIKRYHTLYLDYRQNEERQFLYRYLPQLKDLFIVQSIRTRENAIAPAMTWVNRVVKMESVQPPAGVYEIPKGFRSVASRAELTADETLPQALQIELSRLEETWNILDQYAGKVWPGWTGYRDVPFLINYPNGVRMLVGHPSPPDAFAPVPGLEVGGKKVYLDRSKEIALKLEPPLGGGGGVSNFGKEKRVQTVNLRMSMSRQQEKEERSSERQILINIHELFHCFQRQAFGRPRVGNLNYNTDTNYAVYGEIEGLALERAYLEANDRRAREYIKDFLVARQLKRRSMTELEQEQESMDDFNEGTAVFSEARTLELMKEGYKPLLTQQDDPYFYGFKERARLFDKRLENLRESRAQTMDSRGRCYYAGCFQALLLSRFSPGWQEKVGPKIEYMDRLLADLVHVSSQEEKKIAKRLASRYKLAEITAKHDKLIKERDAAYAVFQQRQGTAYVVNFKPVQEFISNRSSKKRFSLGLIHMYPQGVETIRVEDVVFEGKETPTVIDQLYYIKWIDTETDADATGYRLKYGKKEGEGTFCDAELETKGFLLKAPKIRIKKSPGRVKITILAKIKE